MCHCAWELGLQEENRLEPLCAFLWHHLFFMWTIHLIINFTSTVTGILFSIVFLGVSEASHLHPRNAPNKKECVLPEPPSAPLAVKFLSKVGAEFIQLPSGRPALPSPWPSGGGRLQGDLGGGAGAGKPVRSAFSTFPSLVENYCFLQ